MARFTSRLCGRLLFWSLLGIAAFTITLAMDAPVAFATDSDGDGLEDQFEQAIGSDPNRADSDGDNLNDFDEIHVYGTSPLQMDTDGDALNDDFDPNPLDDGGSEGGRTQPTPSLTRNLPRPSGVGTPPTEGRWVNAITGEQRTPIVTVDLGPGYLGRNALCLYHLSGITLNGLWGRNIVSNWDHRLSIQPSDDVYLEMYGDRIYFDEVNGEYMGEDDFPFALTLDGDNDVYILTAIRGGMQWFFDETDGWMTKFEDRFGNATAMTRNQSGVITTVTLPEGTQVSLTTHGMGRYHEIKDWSSPERVWELTYNYYDELAKFENAEGEISQFFYLNGTMNQTLNFNLTRILAPGGGEILRTQYDEYDRVWKQKVLANTNLFTYTSTYTDVTDWAGNNRRWTYTANAKVPNSLIQYSNRDVRGPDPASWTTTFAHNANLLCTKIVYPAENRTDFDWNSNFCLTEKRRKATDTDDDLSADLVWSYTYGNTYYQLDNSTDPLGNVTDRTLNGDERVTQISYETITHTDPDVTITESFTWNSAGQMTQHTDGEGVATKYDYISSGPTKGLPYTVTKDYGVGKLNLETNYTWSSIRYLTGLEDADGNDWTYTVDDLGRRLTSLSPSPQGYEINYTFGANGLLASKEVENVDKTNTRDATNPWFQTSYTYLATGLINAITEEIDTSTDRTTQFEYDGNGKLSIATLPEGNKIKNVHDERGLLAERIRAYTHGTDASTEYFTCDTNGNTTVLKNGRGKETTRTFDDYDRLTGSETPLGHYTTLTLDKCGNITEIEGYNADDDLLSYQKRHFDEMNRLYEAEAWLDGDDDGVAEAGEWLTTSYDLDKRGLMVGMTDPLLKTTEITYDNAGRKTCWEDHLGNKVEYDYTNDYMVPTQIDEVQIHPVSGTETFVTEVVTDALHRVAERRVVDRTDSQNKHVFKSKYTSLGITAESEDAEENKTYRYHDGLGRILKTERDMGGGAKIVTEMEFDDNDNQTLLTDDSGNETIWRYNARDLAYEIEYDDGEKRTTAFLADDLVSAWTDENGTVVTNTWDNDGRLTGRAITRANGVLGPTSESYSYDGLDRLTDATNDNSVVEMAYDTLSRQLTEVQGPNPLGGNGKTITYTYDDAGNRERCVYFSGYRLDYSVDAVGRWTQIENAADDILVSWSYYGPGRRTESVDYLNGTSETIGYDGFRFVTDVDHNNSGGNFAGFDYGYDKMGNPLYEARTHDSGKGDLYHYDNAYRLKAVMRDQEDPVEDYVSDWYT